MFEHPELLSTKFNFFDIWIKFLAKSHELVLGHSEFFLPSLINTNIIKESIHHTCVLRGLTQFLCDLLILLRCAFEIPVDKALLLLPAAKMSRKIASMFSLLCNNCRHINAVFICKEDNDNVIT